MAMLELQRMLNEMFVSGTRAKVKADPKGNRKITLTEADKSSRRYHQYTNGKGQRVRFYRSCHRNIAGYFLIWRETLMKNGNVKNDMLRAFKSKLAASATNLARYKKARK